jgi:hypothetical protein
MDGPTGARLGVAWGIAGADWGDGPAFVAAGFFWAFTMTP